MLSSTWITNAAWTLCGLHALDRAWKLACVVGFFRRSVPPAPEEWPTVSLIQPITQGASGLPANLTARALLIYEGTVEHLLVCDVHDEATVATCRAFMETWPDLNAQLLLVPNEPGRRASKVEKMQAGMAKATGGVICFIDDDIAPRPLNLDIFVRHLYREGAGGVFGLPCYTNWNDLGSSLMSLFVNANALPSYISLTYLTDPFTITGHFYALRRDVLEAFNGLDTMERYISEDHEVARRIRSLGLRIVQTPAVYDGNNELPTFRAYLLQVARWFVFTGRILWPLTSTYERLVSTLGSLGNLLPGVLLGMALFARITSAWLALGATLGIGALLYGACEIGYLRRRTPLCRWPLLLYTLLVTPWHAVWTLCTGREVIWRGQRIRVFTDGTYEVLD